jgi:hypothetical protein
MVIHHACCMPGTSRPSASFVPSMSAAQAPTPSVLEPTEKNIHINSQHKELLGLWKTHVAVMQPFESFVPKHHLMFCVICWEPPLSRESFFAIIGILFLGLRYYYPPPPPLPQPKSQHHSRPHPHSHSHTHAHHHPHAYCAVATTMP